MNERGHEAKKKYLIGIKWKMFAIIVIFIICVLVSIWFVQVRMLNVFYQNAKFYELEESADAIAYALDDEVDAKNTALYYSDEYYFDIWVLRINDSRGEWLIRTNGSGSSFLPFLSHKIETLYSQTLKNGGKYIATVPADSLEGAFTFEVLEDNAGDKDSFPKVTKYNDAVGTLYSRIVNTSNGNTYMIVQHSSLTPLQTTVSTLKYQFISIGAGMVIMALLLAALLSKLITKPFVKMNEAAKKLAEGNYDADFSGKGYREIDELAETLNYASRELAKTDNLQKELISNISHDLRTPLTMIKGYSEVMRDIPGENTPENIQVIIDETSRLSDLVNDMLDLSKIQSGTRKPKFEEFSITQTVKDTLQRYEKLIMDGYSIEFVTDRDATVYADRVMILQVVYNLINNAINYTGDDKCVTVLQQTTDTHVKISVTDTGEGIRQEDMADIWNRYYRVDKVHKRAAIGTGLGLSIVKGILESHRSEFGVKSTLGEGATFWFELELAQLPDIIDAEYDNSESEMI